MGSVTSRGQLLVVGLHAALGLSVLASATVLSALGIPITTELAGLYGVILGLAGAGSAAVATLGTAVNGKTAIPPAMISEANALMRETIGHLAGARSQVDHPPVEPPPAPAPPA